MKNTANNKVTKFMAILIGLLVSTSMLAQNGNVREETARQVGLNFLRLKDGNPRSDLQLTRVDAMQYPNLYVYNTSENGFIVVASDNRMEPILAYSDEGTFDKDNVAPGANFWFEMYEYAIDSIVRNNVRDVDERITRKWEDLENGVLPEPERSGNYPNTYGPLIGTYWGQGHIENWENNFNALCPWVKMFGKTYKTVTGCVATTLAQILNYYQVDIPERNIWYSFRHMGSNALTFDNVNYSERANGCYLPSRKSYKIGGWGSLTGMNRIAKMMLDCGLAVDMCYGFGESSAKCPNIFACPNESSQESALKQIFGFPEARVYRRFYYGNMDWNDLLKEQIYSNNPVIYDGCSTGRHNFICDGFDGDLFHFNFGWCHEGDGYYLNSNPRGFSSDQIAIILNPVDMEVEYDVITMGETVNKPWCNGIVTIRPGDINGHNNELIIYKEPGVYGLRNFCRDNNKTLVWNVKVLPNSIHKEKYDDICKNGRYDSTFYFNETNDGINGRAEFHLSREQTNYDGTHWFLETIVDEFGNSIGTCTLYLTTSLGEVTEIKDPLSPLTVSFCSLITPGYYLWDVNGAGTVEIKCYGSGHYEYFEKSSNPYDVCGTVYYLDLTIEEPNSPIQEFDTTTCINNIVWKTDRFPDFPISRNINEYGKIDWYQWDNNCDNVYVLHWYYAAKDTIQDEISKCIKNLPFEYHDTIIGNEITQPGLYSYKINRPKDPNDPAQCDKVYLLYLTVTDDCCTADLDCLEEKVNEGNRSTPSNMEAIYYGLKHYYEYRDATNDFLFNVFNGMSWPSMEERNTFWNLFQSLLDTNTGMMSEEAMQQLIVINPYDYITEEYIEDLVGRYNLSVMYWNEGSYTYWDLPEGYNPDFIEYDTASMNKAYEAYDYAIAHGFNDVKAMYDNAYELLAAEVDNIQSAVCAKVTVQFNQKMTMTREAFNGTLQIFNGHESIPMQDIMVDFRITDTQGNDCTNLFQINTLSLDQITGISGDGSLAAQTNGTALVQFIPTKNAAPTEPKVYSFGGSFSFIDPFTGEGLTYPLYPVEITVNPSPDLYVDYFMQRDILGDDALTEDIVEPSVPAELGVIIHNQGAGEAKNVTLETAEPQIIDNERGLAIDFAMYGASFNGTPRQLGLTEIRFGNIGSGQTAVGEWLFTSSLLGHFVSYEANVIHNSSYGNQDLSLVSHLDIHELVHPIYAYGSLDDGINDFLVNDNPDAYDRPDSIYFSHGGKTSVGIADGISFNHYVTPQDTIVTLTLVPSRAGWNYAVTDDPGSDLYEIVSCIRNSDNQVIPLNNVWQTFVTIPDGGDPIYENKLHIIDTLPVNQTTTYTIVYGESPNNSVTQSMTLNQGWNWWSSCIDLSRSGLTSLEDALSEHGRLIKSQWGGFVVNEDGHWYGNISGLDNRSMYRILTNADVPVTMMAPRVNLSQLDIELAAGWNWIGYPLSEIQTVEEALSDIEADPGDMVKSHSEFSIFEGDGEWFGMLHYMVPGQGYMYRSGQPHSFHYHNGRSIVENEEERDMHWTTDVSLYPDNMSVVATVYVDGEEQQSDQLEVGAFSEGKMVGSAQLRYNARRDRWYALIPVSGNDGEEISFRLYDDASKSEYGIEAEERLSFTADEVIGSLDDPMALHFQTSTGIGENTSAMLHIYPNPVKRGGEIRLGLPDDAGKVRVELYNVLEVLVSAKETTGDSVTLNDKVLPGTYILKVFAETGKVYYGKLIVK